MAKPLQKRKQIYKTRTIGALDIKSSAPNYCIDIKESNLFLQYYPNFYSVDRSKEILSELEACVSYNSEEQSSVIVFGKKYQIPRKQTAFGDPGTSYKFSGTKVMAKNWNEMPLIFDIKKDIESLSSDSFNFCLVNRYKDGNDRMGAHKDDERDLVGNASIAGVSFGCSRDIIFKHQDIVRRTDKKDIDPKQVKVVKVALKTGSLLLMQYPTNQFWYHEIPKRAKANSVRISLTYRQMKPT